MTFFEGFLRFFFGGTLVLGVSIIAKYGKSSVAGVMALFPAVTVVSFYFMSKTVEKKKVLEAITASTISFPTVLAFLIVLYFSYQKFDIIKSLLISISGWLITAVAINYIKNLFFRG
jgi:uncharacterized membrane protein (GlpM family)